MKTTGYSLWLVPNKETKSYASLSRLIGTIARRYQTPVFKPHVTLLGGIDGIENEIIKKTRTLAEHLAPYEISCGGVGSRPVYFQTLFLDVIQTKEVLGANDFAQELFGSKKEIYIPHLSLAYGDFSADQVSTLKEFVLQNASILSMKFIASCVELWKGKGTSNA